ncbi:MAG: UDP-N-acetylmuramate dehydrogenase [Pseudomonadota bacterium]|nr:UDP-N-acetylmuramate dehydrogenase [Pseudomonadota bacterium]MEC8270479.1 UDP-N-acetylmuramate dehydrogenase [Pseudomonadota bacterium]
MTGTLFDRLPLVRGDYAAAVPMAGHTWFGVGGPADIIFSPADAADLGSFLAACPADIPLLAVGAGSNLLVRDGGIGGVVIRTPAHMNAVSHDGETVLAGAGALDAEVARHAAKAGLAGLEFLIGIPGTVGGGLRMNAGAYGGEFRDVVIRAHGFDRSGTPFSATPDDMGMAYRHSDAPDDWIFTHAEFRASAGDANRIRARMKEIVASRGDAQPRGVRTGGSTFANPPGGKAWQEIDAAGCRGMEIGAAQVSEKHCNFLINRGGASAHDIESLGETVRNRVAARGGPALRWEIRRVGRLAEGQVLPVRDEGRVG